MTSMKTKRHQMRRRHNGLHSLAGRIGLAIVFFAGNCLLHPVSGKPALEALGLSETEKSDIQNLLLLLAQPSSSSPIEIRMFNAGLTQGDMSGLSGANTICNNSGNKPAGTTAFALISTSTQSLNALPGVPTNLPINGPGGIQIAANWNALFGATVTLDASLFDAGVLPGSNDHFYTGTDGYGDYVPGYSCGDWETTSGNATVGEASLTNEFWIDSTDPPNCTDSYYLVCVAW